MLTSEPIRIETDPKKMETIKSNLEKLKSLKIPEDDNDKTK